MPLSPTGQMLLSQPARAVWIEIPAFPENVNYRDSHSLRGLCGLKFHNLDNSPVPSQSQPARAVWIEIWCNLFSNRRAPVSQPARAVWIEIDGYALTDWHQIVTACEGCVD